MGKTRLHTKRHLKRAARHEAEERKSETQATSGRFAYKHTAEMRKMLRGVDLDRFEALGG